MAGRLLFLLLGVDFVLTQRLCEWKTCRECIRDSSACVWCGDEKFKGNNRCKPADYVEKSWCPSEKIQNPLSNISETISKSFSSEFGNVVQIKPQYYNIKLRVGQELRFPFSFKASDNFPVDIYFLLDASRSMERIKDDLKKQTRNIYETMIRNLTTNVTLGLGTFVDKNLVPFSNDVSANLSYSFKHRLSLTSNITDFETVSNNLRNGINSDDPESGLEGIAQVIACKNEINWRNQSRKILVYMTDQAYHSAGDGKAAGIVKPYDGRCYLDKEGYYSKEREMDYPSVGMINYLAKREEVKILFVSSFSNDLVYRELSKAVDNSKWVKYRFDHITNVLVDTYKEITERVILTVNLTAVESNYLDISFEPNCDEINADNCKVTAGEEKNFTGTIKIKQYFNKERFAIGINPKGLNEKIVLNVTVISDCGCSDVEINSARCNRIGNWSCGVCECPDAKFGPNCECTGNSSLCSPPNSTEICSGKDHGECNSCGRCECAKGYEGTYCEDKNNNCQHGDNDLICSGHGSCLNGKCTCISGWIGPACGCTMSNKTCVTDGMICNSRGHCECGHCKCDTPEKWDARTYDSNNFCSQTHCYDCHSRQCRHLIPCLNCLRDTDSCTDKCGDTLIHLQDTETENYTNWENCTHIPVDFGCYADYKYIYNDNNTITIVVLKHNCSQSQLYMGVISVVVLVAIGLATLLAWKLLTNARDRSEYEAFLKSSEESDSVRNNPTYTAPSTTYHNPAFQKNDS